jgi:hypothetical protein
MKLWNTVAKDSTVSLWLSQKIFQGYYTIVFPNQEGCFQIVMYSFLSLNQLQHRCTISCVQQTMYSSLTVVALNNMNSNNWTSPNNKIEPSCFLVQGTMCGHFIYFYFYLFFIYFYFYLFLFLFIFIFILFIYLFILFLFLFIFIYLNTW